MGGCVLVYGHAMSKNIRTCLLLSTLLTASLSEAVRFHDNFKDLSNWNLRHDDVHHVHHDAAESCDGISDSMEICADVPGSISDETPPDVAIYELSPPAKIQSLSYYYYEWSDSSGGGIRLLNEDGEVEMGVATNNAGLYVHDSDGFVSRGEGVNPGTDNWIKVEVDFDLQDDSFTVAWSKPDDGPGDNVLKEYGGELRFGYPIQRIGFASQDNGEWPTDKRDPMYMRICAFSLNSVPSPIPTPARTPTPTQSNTPSQTKSPTSTSTGTATRTPSTTPSSTPTHTSTRSATATEAPSNNPSKTSLATSTPSHTCTPATPTSTRSRLHNLSETSSSTFSPSSTSSSSSTSTKTASKTPSRFSTSTPPHTPTDTPISTEASSFPTPTASATFTKNVTVTERQSNTPSMKRADTLSTASPSSPNSNETEILPALKRDRGQRIKLPLQSCSGNHRILRRKRNRERKEDS